MEDLSKILSDPENLEGNNLEEVVKIIHNLAPEHADFILWQGLNIKITKNDLIRDRFFQRKYLEAAREAVQIYNEEVQNVSASTKDGCSLMDDCFKKEKTALIDLTEKKTESEQNIDLGQQFLSKGIITGFRNPALGHASITKLLNDNTFTDRNCLDILSTISYLFNRLEKRIKP